MTNYTAPELTQEQHDYFETLRAAAANGQLALMSGLYRGEPRAIVIAVTANPNGGLNLYPIALLVTEDMMPDLADSMGEPTIELN